MQENAEEEEEEGEADACAASASQRLQASALDNHRGTQEIVSGDGMGREHSGPWRARRIASGDSTRRSVLDRRLSARGIERRPPHLPSPEWHF
jgi:hypothetical protein